MGFAFVPNLLLHNLESDSQRVSVLVPIGAEQYKLANLSGRANVLADTWADIIVADANQAKGLACILWQTVKFDISWDMVTIDKLVGHRHVLFYQAIHLRLDRFFLLTRRFVVDDESHLTLLALDVGIATALASKHTRHQLVEQMLSCMSRRELLLMMLIQYKFIFLHLNIEFINSYSISLYRNREETIFFEFNLLLASAPKFRRCHFLLLDME